jgi:glutathione synthase/RimK-type ligase-like ATP-grasp enzyme
VVALVTLDAPQPHFVLLASDHDPRVDAFQHALQQQGLTPATLISYCDFIAQPERLTHALTRFDKQKIILRIDSPGRDQHAYAAILQQGILPLRATKRPYQTAHAIQQQIRQKGRMIAPYQFYAGFEVVMEQVKQTVLSLPDLHNVHDLQLMNHPDDILLAFDKHRCQRYLQQHKIPIPELLGSIQSYTELRQKMREHNMPRVFIKLKHGASAAGIIALESSANKLQIRSTVEYQPKTKALYNTRHLTRSRNEDEIAKLINALCQMEVYAERWIPKAHIKGHIVDVRIVVIGGKAQHSVLRMSKSPITNLHLLNQRADTLLLQQQMSASAWQAMLTTCEQVAALFPQSLYIALDIAVAVNFNKHVVLEVNAFGDLLKAVLYRGLTPQEAEIQHVLINANLCDITILP